MSQFMMANSRTVQIIINNTRTVSIRILFRRAASYVNTNQRVNKHNTNLTPSQVDLRTYTNATPKARANRRIDIKRD